jgi:hypothetical protein
MSKGPGLLAATAELLKLVAATEPLQASLSSSRSIPAWKASRSTTEGRRRRPPAISASVADLYAFQANGPRRTFCCLERIEPLYLDVEGARLKTEAFQDLRDIGGTVDRPNDVTCT